MKAHDMVSRAIVLLLGLVVLAMNAASRADKAGDMVGIWQAESEAMGAGWNDNYRFFENGHFKFNLCQKMFGLERVISINGEYRVRGDTLYLKVESTTERTGGRVVRWSPGEVDSWNLIEANKRDIKEHGTGENRATLEKCTPSRSGLPCIKIDGRPYYKVRDNPLNYP